MLLDVIQASMFNQIATLLVLSAVIGFIGHLLRQPLIVSFIFVGVLVGPSVLGIVQEGEHIDLLAHLGIAVLLFLVGLKLDLKLIRDMGKIALATGLGQVFFTSVVGFFIALLLGYGVLTSVYIAVALTFSSTIIIVKLLSDKKEVDALHGRIALGFLIVQDIVVVLALIVLSAIGIGDQGGAIVPLWQQIIWLVVYGLGLVLFIGLFMRYVANLLMKKMASSSELLVSFGIAWAAFLAMVCDLLGFGQELGGLLAGVALASTAYREALIARLGPVRDFLLLFFFIYLGSQLDLDVLGNQVGSALIFSLFVLIGNPIIVMIIMGLMGYRKRTGFLAGLTVAQISEFSLIFMGMGLAVGHVSEAALGLVTLVGFITIALSVYMITYSQTLYQWLSPILNVFERKQKTQRVEDACSVSKNAHYDVIVFGLGRYGDNIATRLSQQNKRVLGVDFNPELLENQKSYKIVYGDACDQEFLNLLPFKDVKWVIISLPRHITALTHQHPESALISGLKSIHFQGKIAVAAASDQVADQLKAQGIDLILRPFDDAANEAAEKIETAIKATNQC